jgi:hypothetical protein
MWFYLITHVLETTENQAQLALFYEGKLAKGFNDFLCFIKVKFEKGGILSSIIEVIISRGVMTFGFSS